MQRIVTVLLPSIACLRILLVLLVLLLKLRPIASIARPQDSGPVIARRVQHGQKIQFNLIHSTTYYYSITLQLFNYFTTI